MTETHAPYQRRKRKTEAEKRANRKYRAKQHASGKRPVLLPLQAAVLAALDDITASHSLPGNGIAQRRAAAVAWLVEFYEQHSKENTP